MNLTGPPSGENPRRTEGEPALPAGGTQGRTKGEPALPVGRTQGRTNGEPAAPGRSEWESASCGSARVTQTFRSQLFLSGLMAPGWAPIVSLWGAWGSLQKPVACWPHPGRLGIAVSSELISLDISLDIFVANIYQKACANLGMSSETVCSRLSLHCVLMLFELGTALYLGSP